MHDTWCIHRFSSFDLWSSLKSDSYIQDFPRNGQLWPFLFSYIFFSYGSGHWHLDGYIISSREDNIWGWWSDDMYSIDSILQMSEGILFSIKTMTYV